MLYSVNLDVSRWVAEAVHLDVSLRRIRSVVSFSLFY